MTKAKDTTRPESGTGTLPRPERHLSMRGTAPISAASLDAYRAAQNDRASWMALWNHLSEAEQAAIWEGRPFQVPTPVDVID